jgi:RIO kinase 1
LKTPERLEALVHEGLIDAVLRQLMSGKEATVYVVRCGHDVRCAKVYKDANKRNFRQAALYQEGRKTKNSRQARAIEKGTRYGRKAQEEAWQSVEVDTLCRLAAAGVRVPRPYGFFHGVVLMELLTDKEGNAAPRLNDLVLSQERALAYHATLIRQIVRMLCAGVIHGDLSEYNVLVDRDGPVIIDLPQAVNAAGNNNAARMLQRDADNITTYFSRFAPALASTQFGKEIWTLYERGALHEEVRLTGHVAANTRVADVAGVMREIRDVRAEHEARLRYKAELEGR